MEDVSTNWLTGRMLGEEDYYCTAYGACDIFRLPRRIEALAMRNKLYCGDNLDVLRHCIADESIDLVYLDPPFKSDQNYNLLFREKDGSKSASQILAFEDTWEWNVEAERNYASVADKGGKLGQIMVQFRTMLGDTDMLAYLSMMAPRLVELQRVLRPTGTIYLHCDPTASHYLKILLDAIFGAENFTNEIVWRRTRAHNDAKLTRFGAVHDIIFFYSESKSRRFNRMLAERDELAPNTHDLYRHTDGKVYRKGDCRAPGDRGPKYKWNGHIHNWRFTEQEARRLESEGRIVYSKTGMPRVLRPVDLTKGSALQDVWVDIDAPNSGSAEILGYPTQKPLSLLRRILDSSSNEGDTILDPFCGCGTAIEAAITSHRRWIGIDITIQAMRVTRNERLPKLGGKADYDVIYRPCDLSAAAAFAAEQPFAFQDWAVEKLDGIPSRPRSGDRGIDGRLYYREDGNGPLKHIIVSVKGGKLKATFVRELQGAVARDRAPMGVLIVLNAPTKQMIRDAASSGFYRCSAGTFPKIQIITVKDILADVRVDLPPIQRMDESRKRTLAADAATQLPLPGIAS
jgi:site-specific DNA-methyltransferase (adenine-specific)